MEPAGNEIPAKDFYKLNEVCQYTDTQPYVLRFWESEFPQLSPTKRGSGRLYSREDIDVVRRIKELLYDEEFTIASARQQLEQELSGKRPRKAVARPEPVEAEPEAEAPPRPAASSAPVAPAEAREAGSTPRLPLEDEAPQTVPRERYENAIDEIEHLRFQLREAEKAQRKADSALERRDQTIEQLQRRSHGAQARLERLLVELEASAGSEG